MEDGHTVRSLGSERETLLGGMWSCVTATAVWLGDFDPSEILGGGRRSRLRLVRPCFEIAEDEDAEDVQLL